jgi:hypothetical protein
MSPLLKSCEGLELSTEIAATFDLIDLSCKDVRSSIHYGHLSTKSKHARPTTFPRNTVGLCTAIANG